MKTACIFKLVEKAVPRILQSSAKTLKVQNVERQRLYRKVLSINENPGLACYHTTRQKVAPTINNCNVQAKGKTPKLVSALQS